LTRTILIVSLLGLTACSTDPDRLQDSTTFSPDIPVTRLEMPETPGRGRLQGLAFHGLNSRHVVRDERVGQSEQAVRYDGEDAEPVIGASYGLRDNWSLGLRLRTDLKRASLKSRLQLMGPPAFQAARGDFSLSLGLGYGATRHQWDDDDGSACLVFCDLFDSDGDLRGRYGMDIKEASLIAGYRPADPVLVFGGAFYQDVNYSARIEYIDPNDSSNNVTNTEIDAVWQRGGNLGLGYQFGKVMLLMEYVRYDVSWDGKDRVEGAEAFTGGLHAQF
jgi:hypothetical protein